jgi:hypothetical protein
MNRRDADFAQRSILGRFAALAAMFAVAVGTFESISAGVARLEGTEMA